MKQGVFNNDGTLERTFFKNLRRPYLFLTLD